MSNDLFKLVGCSEGIPSGIIFQISLHRNSASGGNSSTKRQHIARKLLQLLDQSAFVLSKQTYNRPVADLKTDSDDVHLRIICSKSKHYLRMAFDRMDEMLFCPRHSGKITKRFNLSERRNNNRRPGR